MPKYRIQSPGYRYLNPGEIIKQTDDWWPANFSSFTSRAGQRVKSNESECYRRAYNQKVKK